MKPVGFEGANMKLGEIPAYLKNGMVSFCWELSQEELVKVLNSKKVFITVNLNGQEQMQPTLVHVDSPVNVGG